MTARSVLRGCAAAMMAAALLLAPPARAAKPRPSGAPAPPARAAKPSPSRAPAPPTLREVARDFESRRLIAGAERVTFLRGTQEAVRALLARELPADQKFAARFLAGTLSFELGDYRAASESFDRAVELAGKSAYVVDVEFARIQSLEAAGHDDEAARAWVRWEKRFDASPLLSEARLAAARNALRRGRADDAEKILTALVARSPWMAADRRVVLARGLAAYLDHRPAEALARLGAPAAGKISSSGKPTEAVSTSGYGSAAATYLAALCQESLGARLRAAALYQEAAERFPDSPIRDHALLAKANAFLAAGDDRSAAEEFARVAARVNDPAVRAEAELRGAGARFLSGRADSALVLVRAIAQRYAGTGVAARAQFLVGAALAAGGHDAEAIVEYNRVLTSYFQFEVAASAQYQVARCLDRLGRRADATGAYQAVVSGYPLAPESPAAAYLAGVGLMRQGRPLAAAPYFQIVLDRYAPRGKAPAPAAAILEHRELIDAALCMLELAYHRTGNLGQLSGAPHLLLQQLPADSARSPWRAWALLIDADAMAAMARYGEAQTALERLAREYSDQAVAASALKLLAWTYAREGNDSLAVVCEERLLDRYGASGREEVVSAAVLDIAHERFNQRHYREAAASYEDFLRRYPNHPRRLLARYQCGLAYLRLNRAGDAVDRWEAVVKDSAAAPIAERAWARMGDTYFQAERYTDAKRSYDGLLEHFDGSPAAALATLRLAQCEYNAGHDEAALEGFSNAIAKFPGTPEAREAQRGTELSLYRLSQRPDAHQVLAKLIEQFPASAFAADAQFQIARRQYQEKRWPEAVEGFRRVVTQFPGYSAADQAQFLLADAWQQAKQPDEARQAYEQFLSFFPGSKLAPTVEFRLGLLAFDSKDYARAAVAFTRALDDTAAGEMRSAARYNLALCHRQLGDPEAARAELERHREEFPADGRAADVAYQLGDLNETAGHVPEAIADYERSLAAHPRPALQSEVAYRLGKAHEQLGHEDAALRAYREAATAGTRTDAYRLSAVARVASLYEKRKDYARAVAAYRDIAQNATDRELAAAAADRASQLAGSAKR